LNGQFTQDEEDVDANTGADEDSEEESELSEVESAFKYEQNEEVNDIFIQELNKEI
jgi:U3 small nucleolar ribonucleoprotein component